LKKEINIKLNSRHDRQGEEPELLEVISKGFYESASDGVHKIVYEESHQVQDENGKIHNVKALNTVRIFEERIEITRAGEAVSHMVFSEGKKHQMDYNTPYGVIKMDIATRRLNKSVGNSAIKVELDYDLIMENQILSKSSLIYDIKFI